jgi:phosphoribosylformimino-5-aminoimidazole carboxamide ribotide isomerase
MLEIIPAIDIKDGRCVRLVQGDMKRETVYYEDPLEAAHHWVRQGAPRLHLVDLNGAISGTPCNLQAVRRIVTAVPVPVQLGGGIRGQAEIDQYLDMGVGRLILGTLACRDPARVQELAQRYPGKLVLGIDARDGFVAVEGWANVTRVRATSLLASYGPVPLAAVIYTDIHRDGMLSGPNTAAIETLLPASPFPVIASGGISDREHVQALARLEPAGLCGAILGKALYAGRLSYQDAREAAAEVSGSP